MKISKKLYKFGHSLGVIIPSEIAKKLDLKQGQVVEVDLVKDKIIIDKKEVKE